MKNNKPIQPKQRETFIPLTFYHFHRGEAFKNHPVDDFSEQPACRASNPDSVPLWVCTYFEQVKENGGLVYVSQN